MFSMATSRSARFEPSLSLSFCVTSRSPSAAPPLLVCSFVSSQEKTLGTELYATPSQTLSRSLSLSLEAMYRNDWLTSQAPKWSLVIFFAVRIDKQPWSLNCMARLYNACLGATHTATRLAKHTDKLLTVLHTLLVTKAATSAIFPSILADIAARRAKHPFICSSLHEPLISMARPKARERKCAS